MENFTLQILLAEADPSDFQHIRDLLAESSHTITLTHVESLNDAFDHLKRAPCDVLLLDMGQPDVQGVAMLDRALSAVSLPIVVLADADDGEFSLAMINRGAQDLLVKDELTSRSLARALRHAVERQKSGERLRYQANLLRSLGDAVISGDNEFIIQSWNDAAQRMYGWAADEVIGQSFPDILDPQYVGITRDEVIEQFRETNWYQGEVSHRCKDGSRIDAIATASRVHDSSGKPIGIVSVSRDMTEHRAAQNEIRRLNTLNEEIIQGMSEGITIDDVDDRIIFANPAAARILGHLQSELVDHYWSELLTPEQNEAVERINEQRRQGITSQYELEYIRPDGDVRTLLVSGSPRFAAGEFVGTMAVFSDITEHRLAQQAYKAVVENSLQGMVIMQNDRFVFANPQTTEISGYSLAELYDMTPEDMLRFVPPEDQVSHLERWSQLVVGGDMPQQFEVRMLKKSGERRWLEIFTRQIQYRGQPSIQATVVDVTDRKQAEERLSQYANRLSILREIDQAILIARSAPSIAVAVLERIPDLMTNCQNAGVTLYEPETGTFRMIALKRNGNTPVEVGNHGFPPFKQSNNRVFAGKLIHVRDIREIKSPTPVQQHLLAEGVLSYIALPLMARGRLIGLFNLGSNNPDAFAEEDIDIARDIARQLAIAFDQANLLEAEREQRALAEALRDISSVLTTLDMDGVMHHILEQVGRAIVHDAANIMLINPDNETLRIVGYQGYEDYVPASALESRDWVIKDLQAVSHIFELDQPFTIPNTEQEELWTVTPASTWTRSYVGAPIRLRGTVIGVINLHSAELGFYTAEHAQRLQAFADQAAIAIENTRLYSELANYNSNLARAVAEATSELQREKDLAEAVMNSAADAMLVTDPYGVIRSVNPAFVRQMGYAVEEIVGQKTRVLTSPLGQRTVVDELLEAAQQERAWRGEILIRRKDGGEYEADVTMAPLIPRDHVLMGYVIAIRDISAFKEVDRIKDQFLSTAAHELRTPLTSIRGFSEILLTRSLDEERQKRYLTTINEQSTNLGQIIDDLLDVSRIDAGRKLDISPVCLDTATVIAEVVQPFIENSPRHRFDFQQIMQAPPVLADAFRMAQVMGNLVSNAVKYSPDGGLITFASRVQDGMLEIRVTDQGIGMTPEQQQHLFERFYRASNGNNAIGGTGLGLTICKLIVEQHGGRISADSEYGVGSTFTITLPLCQEEVSD